jgi:hypothetical protein
VYPPLAAIADDAGGLVAARLLSLAFMLIATWSTTRSSTPGCSTGARAA